MIHSLKAVVFDFDGTLAIPTINFNEMKQRAHTAVKGVYPNLPDLNGLPLLEWLDMAQKQAAQEKLSIAEAIEKAAISAAKDVELEAAARSDVFTWGRKLLSELLKRDIIPCIVTRNCTEAVHIVFPDVDEYCPIVLTRDDVPMVKPDPDHLHRALVLAGCQPEEAIMTGDHIMDIHTGKAAGTLTAGVCTGEATREELEAEHPDFIAADCWDLFLQITSR
ncbi:HAD family hydrolase [Halodesulfovibrio aestuarii]|uniref:phosphoglycolate phosphatase n=1 Tax=Halodesulfovibrio aestuarii TaxID=126333 RepID=A0ABV4JTX7_9BACT